MAEYYKAIYAIVMSKLVLFLVVFPVLKIKSSFLNIEEIQKAKYGVEISGEPVLLNEDTDETIMHIKSKHGQEYQCVLPVVHVTNDETNARNVTTEEINDLLQPVNNTCLYFLNGWWTYKACFGKAIFQYHEEGLGLNNVRDNISLGLYTGGTDWSSVNIEENSNRREQYHSQFYNNGTLCDLTGELRKTEVRFFCRDGAMVDNIARIDESATCSYIITVYTNKLCNHSIFRQKQPPKKYGISCSPALHHEQLLKYKESKEDDDDISVDDMLSPASSTEHDDNDDEVRENTKKRRIPSIFEALGRLWHDSAGANENKKIEDDSGNTIEQDNDDDKIGQDNDNKIAWEDVLKTSKSAIDKSMENIRKRKLHEKLEHLTENEAGKDSDTSSPATEKGKEQLRVTKTDLNELFETEKEKLEAKGKYYHDLIEGLKIQYRFFKTQLEIATKDMHAKIERLENGEGKVNPLVIRMVERIKASVQQFEENQRNLDVEMERLTTLNEAVMQDGNPAALKEEIAGIRSRLKKIMNKISAKHSVDDDKDIGEEEASSFVETNKGESFHNDRNHVKQKHNILEMTSPKLDKVVSKLKKIMTQDAENGRLEEDNHNEANDVLDDNRISVRVMKIRDQDDDLFDDASSHVEDERDLEDVTKGDKEMMTATKKMESIVRKQLQDSGVKLEGKIKVKIITSKDTLRKVSGGTKGFQILSPSETNEFRDLLSNLLGGRHESVKEKKKQDQLENNYSLVWTQNGFKYVKDEYTTVEHQDEDTDKYYT